MRKAILRLLMFILLAGQVITAGEIPSRDIPLTGDLLIMPLVDRNDSVQKPIPGRIRILVDGRVLGVVEGKLEPLPASRAVRAREVPALIEIFSDNRMVARLISPNPLPDMSALAADGENDVTFEILHDGDTVLYRVSGRMKAQPFEKRLDVLRASGRPGSGFVSIQVDAKQPIDQAPVHLALTASLEVEQLSPVPEAARKKADIATFDVRVDGQLVQGPDRRPRNGSPRRHDTGGMPSGPEPV